MRLVVTENAQILKLLPVERYIRIVNVLGVQYDLMVQNPAGSNGPVAKFTAAKNRLDIGRAAFQPLDGIVKFSCESLSHC